MHIDQSADSKQISAMLVTGIALLFLAQAIQFRNGIINSISLIFLAITIISIAVAILVFHYAFPKISYRYIELLLLVGLIIQIIQLIISSPTQGVTHLYAFHYWQFRTLILAAGICALVSLAPDRWIIKYIRKALIILTFVFIFVAGIWFIKDTNSPFIDVFLFNQTSAEALATQKNPYELTEPNIYGDLSVYGPELVSNGRMTIGNPYPPLSIYISSLGYFIAGDVRYSHLVAILVAAALIASFTHTRNSRLASYLLLFSPRLFYIIEYSWTEPLVIMLFAQSSPQKESTTIPTKTPT